MSILILGGTGAMGSELVKILPDYMNATVTSRKRQQNTCPNIEYIQGNAKDDSFLADLLANHWGCIIDFMSYSTNEFRKRVNKLLRATEQYIFISSARVYAPSDTPLTEKSPRLLDVCTDKKYLSTDEYALAKARQEDILIATACNNNFTIVRPGLTYNSYRLQFAFSEKEEWLFRVLNGNSVFFPMDMHNIKASMTDAADTAKALYRLIGNVKALGQVIQIANPESLTWKEILAIYENVLMIRGYKIRIFSDYESTKAALELGRYYQIEYARGINRSFSAENLQAIVGPFSFTSMKRGLTKRLEIFLEKPGFRKISPIAHAYYDRIMNEHTTFSGLMDKIKYNVFSNVDFLRLWNRIRAYHLRQKLK